MRNREETGALGFIVSTPAPRKKLREIWKMDRSELTEDVIHGLKEFVNERKETQGGERLF